jgi:hypothetical protein
MPDDSVTSDTATVTADTSVQATSPTVAHKQLAAEITAEFTSINADFQARFAGLSAKIETLPDVLKSDIEGAISRLRSAL